MFKNLSKKVKEVLVDPTTDVQRVNCVNLVPPLESVRRWHCNMGDGREGDCFIFLKKKESCRFHDPKYKPLSKEEVAK